MRKLSLFSLLFLGACAVGPNYHQPNLILPLHWLGIGQGSQLVTTQENATKAAAWWKAFNDPTLNTLMEQALTRNADLRLALSRITEARGARLSATSALFPSLDGNANIARGDANATGRLNTTSAATLDASWEIDLFGGNRRAAEAARARLGGAEAEARLTQLRLMAEVAIQYLDVRRLQNQLALARKNLEDQNETLRLVQAQYKEGLISNLIVSQNEAQAGSTAAAIPLIESNLISTLNGLGVLVGAQPAEIAQTVGAPAPVPVITPQVIAATPATVIANRPDVQSAERELAAATADKGVALSNWFPHLSLTGLFGIQDFGTGNREGWSAGGTISLPLINFGYVRGLVRQADARQKQALITYEQTVLAALADVETSLTAYVKSAERLEKLQQAATASEHASSLAKLQYKEGVASNLDVILAEQQQLSADDALAAGQAAVGQSLATLYKSLGGI